MEDSRKVLAEKIINILRDQKPGDVEELRFLASQAKEQGFTDLAEHAEEIASMLEQDDKA